MTEYAIYEVCFGEQGTSCNFKKQTITAESQSRDGIRRVLKESHWGSLTQPWG